MSDALPPSQLSKDGIAVPIGYRARDPQEPAECLDEGIELGGVVFYDRPLQPWQIRTRRAVAVFGVIFLMAVLALMMWWLVYEPVTYDTRVFFSPESDGG